MAANITVYPYLSPRLIEINSPQTSVSIQDLLDAIRAWEDANDTMSFDFLIDAAGKEDLGGGVTVGITATLQNAQVYFTPRSTPTETGTTTSTGTTTLTDTSATFQTSGITRGANVTNHTDGSVATVLDVLSETQLTHTALEGGANNDWTISDSYNVHNIVQCNITGGNLVAVDDVGADLDPVFASAYTQVVKTSSSSATIAQLEVTNLQYMIESLRDSHSATGNLWYWDPYNGNDANTGTSPTSAVKSFSAAQDLAGDWNHDVIIAIPGNPSDHTVYTEPIEITKNWLFIRGPGSGFSIKPTSANADNSLISIPTSEGITISGIILDGADGPASTTGIKMTAHDMLLANMTIENITGDGVHTSNCHTDITRNVKFKTITGSAIKLEDCTGFKADNVLIDTAAIGIESIAATPGSGGEADIDDVAILNSPIGISVGTNTTKFKIRDNCRFVNVNSHIVNNGSFTSIEQFQEHIHGGIAQGSGTGNNQIQLDVNASSSNGAYDPALILITGGSGQGQLRLIMEYDGTTKIATLDRDWKFLPDNTSEFRIIPNVGGGHVNEGLAQGGTTSSMTLNVNADSTDNIYIGQTIFIRSGTGQDQTRTIIAYNGTTKVATVNRPWETIPDATTGYVMIPSDGSQYINELWKLQGLDGSNPMTVTKTQRTVDNITLDITGDGINTATVTRQ